MKKMGKKFIAGTAMAAGISAMLSGCTVPGQSVYGPPPSETTMESSKVPETSKPISDTTEPISETAETTEAVTNNYDPTTDVNVDVYGPPEYFE